MRTGGCRCGEVRFSVAGDPVGGVACHCRDCQYVAGGGANLTWIFDWAAFQVERGTPRCFKAQPSSGGTFFCEVCGVHVYSKPDNNPDIVAIKVGAFDNAEGFSVQADMWMSSAPAWHQTHIGASQFDKNIASA